MPYTNLSITIDTLPPTTPYVRDTPIPHHGLIIVREGITYGALVDSYVRNLPTSVRRWLFSAAEVPDPIDTPHLFRTAVPWWDPDAPVTAEGLFRMERSRLITPWPHAWLV